jgi:hypothetical protein
MGQRQKYGWSPTRKLRIGPSTKIIQAFAIRSAGRLCCGSDPHDQVSTFSLRL